VILLQALTPGLLATVQDLGRPGYLDAGLPPSGALDPVALRAANMLAGNPPGAAALELTLWGGTWQCMAGGWVALAGASMEARWNGEALSGWRSWMLQPGDRLSFGQAREGCRAYLALQGGVDVPEVLGSRSTYLRAGLGGLEGRAIRAGDLILGRTAAERGEESPAPREKSGIALTIDQSWIPRYLSPCTLRVLWGPQEDRFPPETRETFARECYRITEHSDRMGCRLQGPTLAPAGGSDILSEPISPGAVQVTSDGQPIVLLADRQTAGGYAKIATVISADLWKAGQLRPGDQVRFRPVTLHEARSAWQEHLQFLDDLHRNLLSF
jgi:antagonist of KipI